MYAVTSRVDSQYGGLPEQFTSSAGLGPPNFSS